MKANTKKAAIALTDIQSAVVRKYSVLSSKGADAWNSLTAYSQDFMKAAVLFDGSWSEEAIEELNDSLKAMQSKLERKSTGYSTFSSAKAVILKALRAGIENVQIPKSELEAQAKAAAKAAEAANGEGESEEAAPQAAPKQSAEALIEAALKALMESGDGSPVKTAQGLLIKAAAKLNTAKK